jgi:hypothetical protein
MSLAEVHEEAMAGKNGKALNALDLPTPSSSRWQPAEMATDLQAYNYCIHPSAKDLPHFPQYPLDENRWGLYGTGGSFHYAHQDAAGYASYITVLAGKKFWTMLFPNEQRCWAEFAAIDAYADVDNTLSKAKNYKKVGVVLTPGDTM